MHRLLEKLKRRNRDADDDAKGLTESAPRWVKVSGIIVLAIVLLFVGLKLMGVGGEHGPNRHGADKADDKTETDSDDMDGHGAPGWVPDHGGQ